ncbi:MAG: dihydrofolate reductase [Gammaproteobacteria bacterium]|nr:dihydrofolate reductase [Gammaproteobacteria bacterium]
MFLSLIVALDRRLAIGKNNAMPWHLSADLRYFKRTTMGKPVIMGRKTFESVGRPLPGRQNVVITRNSTWQAPGCTVYQDLETAFAELHDLPEAFVIGGGQIYAATLHKCRRLHVTHVEADIDGDVFFPALDWRQWRATEVARHGADESNTYAFRIVVYEPVEG